MLESHRSMPRWRFSIFFCRNPGSRASAPLPIASILHNRLVALIAQGDGEMDYAAISRLVRRDAGLNDAPVRG